MSPQTQSDDIGMGEASPDRPLFDETLEAIQHTLLEQHRRVFNHVEASVLLEGLRSTATHNDTQNRTLAACCRKFALFVQTFAPYFNVLSICTHVRTEWSGCFWGVVGLLFQEASDNLLFLEKIANTLEAMASVLPPYHQIYAICKRRIGNVQDIVEDENLATLMSHVYLDIVTILLDMYRVFGRTTQGATLRHSTKITYAATPWRPMDFRFAQLEGRLTHHRRWLEKETESHIQDFAEIEHQRKKYLRFLQRQHVDTESSKETEEEKISKRLRRVEIVQRWLSNASQPEHIGKSIRMEDLGSCNWFFDLPKYRKWKSRSFEQSRANDMGALQGDWHDRILFVQAEAGYGKTVFSRAVADDLTAEAEDPENSNEQPCTAFFQANSSRSDPLCPDQIFRQFSLQLLHANRHDHATLDATCLLLRKTSFRDTATADEILDVLLVLLRQHPSYLVIDGLEQCSDIRGFLTALANLLRKADARAMVFSRPAIAIPLEYQKWASDAPHILHLDPQENAGAIESFLAQHLNHMADQGYFGISLDRALIAHVARLSKGTFLWASLLLRFLQSTAISPDERQAILHDVHAVQSLEALYSSIIRSLAHRPGHEKRMVADLFRWLSFPVHRLCTSALRTALTSSIDFAENEDSYPTDVLKALPQLTCGLVEVSEDSVFFTHPSIRDYLHSPASQGSEFSLGDESSVHAHLTARCLSYLAHHVPKRPLGGLSPHIRPMIPTVITSSGASYRTSKSGDSGYKSLSSLDGDNALPHPAIRPQQNTASTASIRTVPFDTTLPFLRYASLCWPIHLSRALSPAYDHHPYVVPATGPFSAVPYIPALSAFLSSRLAVTAWVEASFRYNLPPTLTRLVGPLSDLKAEIPPATIEGKELRLVLNELSILSERLMGLKRGYATSLRENPSLIWQMEGMEGEEYWPIWNGGTGMPR